MAENHSLAEHVSGISPLRARAIDGSPKPVYRKSPSKPSGPQSSAVARRWVCPLCDFTTADAVLRGDHLHQHLKSGDASSGELAGEMEAEERTAVPIADAIAAYLATLANPGTARVYGQTLCLFAVAMADEPDLLSLTQGKVAGWFTARWESSSPSTWNRNLCALRAAAAYWADQGWTLRGSLADNLTSQPVPKPRASEITREEIAELLSCDAPLRERALWAVLYEAAASPGDALALNVDDLDMRSRVALTRDGEIIVWGDVAARLLADLIKGRRGGPVFLTSRRARVQRARDDLQRGTGRGRLSHRQAATLLEEFTAGYSGGPWTLLQLRHAALAHALADGVSVREYLAKSRNAPMRDLARYAEVT